MDSKACHGQVFNLGSDRPISIGELAALVIRLTRSSSKVEYVPYTTAYPPGFEDLPDRRPSLEKVRRAIGFEVKRTLEQTISDVAEWLQGHGHWGERGEGAAVRSKEPGL